MTASIASYDKMAEKSSDAGNTKKANEASESAQARKVWLAEAQKSLDEFN